MAEANGGAARKARLAQITGLLFGLTALPLIYGGVLLMSGGGSPYYLIAGLTLLASGALLIRRRTLGALLYLALYIGTWGWALHEVGLDFWALSPRIVAPTLFALLASLSLALTGSQSWATANPALAGLSARRLGLIGSTTLAILLAVFAIFAFESHGAIYGNAARAQTPPATAASGGDWIAYGRTTEGRRYAPFTQIDQGNIGQLQVAWIARTGDVPGTGAADENTPLQIRDRLVSCGPHSVVNAIDAETGKILWTFNPHADSIRPRCRSVGYYRSTAVDALHPADPSKPCGERVVIATNDARLIEIDLETGRPCLDFGKAGTVDLKVGLGIVQPTHYFQTSAPTVAGQLIIVGGTVIDSTATDVPSGVVRAFDARTGERRWFWDLGQATNPNALPSPDAVFTRGTPNVWAPPAVDEALGLVFLPTGNPSPDHWGGNRTHAMERYGSSIVALDIATGKERWTFQTTHHDLWDYDVASQPTVYDMPDGRGGRAPALIVPTKRGQIFVLDRRTGVPLTPVEERPAPRGAAAGDHLSPTQPYSVGMPTINGPRLTEASMWGFSPLDQLWCRIAFRKLRYAGDFTPPGVDPSLLYPGTYGGLNWGSASIDERRDLLIINDIRLPMLLGLIPRAEADREGKKLLARYGAKDVQPGHGGLMPQKGTPFAAFYLRFVSPLGIPCQAPPFGTMTAIDLNTRKVAWQVPIGTVRDSGPLGTSMHLPIPLGLPTIGGSLVTGSGLVFFSGSQDHYLRALDSATGRELWKIRLPIGSEATPMTYVSPRSGRQFIVVAVGGGRDSTAKGDYVIAFSLPSKKGPTP